MQRPSLTDMLRTFLFEGSPEDAITLNQLIKLDENIADCQFIAATPKALRLYGREQQSFVDSWQSLTQPFDVFLRSRELAIARHYGLSLPSRYITQIVRPNGSTVDIIKETREIHTVDSIYWLTRLYPASEEPDLPELTSIDIPSGIEDTNHIGGYLCMAEVRLVVESAKRAVLRDGSSSALQRGHNLTNLRQIMSTDPDKVVKTARNGTVLSFGQPVTELNNGQRILECQTCAFVWPRVRDGLPMRCSNSTTRCYDWQEPVMPIRHESEPNIT